MSNEIEKTIKAIFWRVSSTGNVDQFQREIHEHGINVCDVMIDATDNAFDYALKLTFDSGAQRETLALLMEKGVEPTKESLITLAVKGAAIEMKTAEMVLNFRSWEEKDLWPAVRMALAVGNIEMGVLFYQQIASEKLKSMRIHIEMEDQVLTLEECIKSSAEKLMNAHPEKVNHLATPLMKLLTWMRKDSILTSQDVESAFFWSWRVDHLAEKQEGIREWGRICQALKVDPLLQINGQLSQNPIAIQLREEIALLNEAKTVQQNQTHQNQRFFEKRKRKI